MTPSCNVPFVVLVLGIFLSILEARIDTIGGDSHALTELTSEFFEWRLMTSPEYGTKFGLRSHDSELEQYTEAAMLEHVTAARGFLRRAEMVNSNLLTVQEGITLEVLKDLLTTYIEGYQYRYYGAYIGIAVFDNPLIEMDKLISWTKFEVAKDYEKALRRYRAFVDTLEQKKHLIRLAIRNQTTGSLSGLNASLETFESFPSDPEETFFYGPFKDISNITGAGDLQSRAIRLIRDTLTPAVRNFTTFLKEEYKPHARISPAVTSLPGGKAYYRACLKWHLSLDMTPKDIYDLGRAEVKRISGNIQKLMAADNFVGDVRSYIAHLKNESENMFTEEEEMRKVYRETIDQIHHHMASIMTKVPKAPLIVKSTPSSKSSTGRYTEPSLDGSRPGIFFVNTHQPKTRARFSVMALTLHEAEPGHHTQMAFAIEEDIPNFRRAIEYRKYYAVPFNWPFYTAYVEGWALYAESLGEEMGLYSDPTSLLGRYTSEILRACRLVVDVGLHEYGWSVERAEQYLLTYTHLPINQIRWEIRRYTDYPGQATAYKVGELTIKRLRKAAREKLGAHFDLKAFHTAILQVGPVPLSTLERTINSWVQHQTARAAAIRDSYASSCQKPEPLNSVLGLLLAVWVLLKVK